MLYNKTMTEQTKNPKKIFFLAADYFGCGWYRCQVPGVELKKRGHTVVMDHRIRAGEFEKYDVLVFQRQWKPEAISLIQTANSLGKMTVFELDDNIWHIHKTNPGYEYWQDSKHLIGAQEVMAECKAITTTTKPLADEMSKYNENVYVLPNMMPEKFWEVKKPKRDDDKIVVGWAGSMHHWDDLLLLSGSIEQLLDQYPNVEFQIAGASEYPYRKHKQIKGMKAVKLEAYPSLLASFDIGLAPLVDTLFNRCKSDLKFLEYGMVSVAMVASKVATYTDSIVQGETGFLARNNKDWFKYTKRLIEDKKLRDRIAKDAHEYAMSRTIERNIHLWEEVYGID